MSESEINNGYAAIDQRALSAAPHCRIDCLTRHTCYDNFPRPVRPDSSGLTG